MLRFELRKTEEISFFGPEMVVDLIKMYSLKTCLWQGDVKMNKQEPLPCGVENQTVEGRSEDKRRRTVLNGFKALRVNYRTYIIVIC